MTGADTAATAAGAAWRHGEVVRPEWVDYNGHMNVAFYVLVFDHATDAALDRLMLGEEEYRRQSGCSVFVGEMHVTYRREVLEGDELTVATRLLAGDDRCLVLFHEMSCPRFATPVAGNEVLCVHVDLGTRRSAPWPASATETLARALASQARASPPKQAGRSIRLLSRS